MQSTDLVHLLPWRSLRLINVINNNNNNNKISHAPVQRTDMPKLQDRISQVENAMQQRQTTSKNARAQ